MSKTRFFLFVLFYIFTATNIHSKQWTLQECIDYALKNNISIRKSQINKASAYEDYQQSRAALLPSLSASTNHGLTYRPFPESSSGIVSNGYVQSGVDKVYYNGSYGVSGSWTVWDGQRTHNQIRLNEMAMRQAELDSAMTANTIQEQIVQLFVQILYSNEAISVHEANLETSRKNEQRGEQFVEVGKMSRADLSQLTSQRAQDEYELVEAQSNLRNYKRQLRQLLQLTDDEEFDIVVPNTTNEMALRELPMMQTVYQQALERRPEIQNAYLNMEMGRVSKDMAKAQRLPSIALNASAITNTSSMAERSWGTQIKNNFNIGAGVSVNIPIFDNRTARTAINKAQLQIDNSALDLEDKRTELYSEIENYWIQASINQNKFRAAQVASQSQQTSYELLSEQFRLGLKNIVELMTGKDNLIAARQNELQSKYLTILYIDLLEFYANGTL